MRTRTTASRSGAEQARIAADVDALKAALQADDQPRQSPIYRWLDARHDLLLANLGGRRVNWIAFAAHLAGLGLTDGKGSAPTSSVARNTWHRVKSARSAAGSVRGSALSIAVKAPAPADHHGGEAAQNGLSTAATVTEAPVHGGDAPQGVPVFNGDSYPPGVRALTASEVAQDPPGDGASDDPGLPASHSPTAPDRAQRALPSKGEHRSGEVLGWTATFASPPPADVLDLLKKNGGKWDKERRVWSGVSRNDLDSLATAIGSMGGSLQVSPNAQAMI